MKRLSLQNEEMMDILTHQMIHMDQGISYCPEYLVGRRMICYPSRTAQIIRSAYLGEIPYSDYGADIVFQSILSAQGERWQNFGENQNSYFLSLILGRELFGNKGYKKKERDLLLKRVIDNGGHYIKIDNKKVQNWKDYLPLDSSSEIALYLDDETFEYAYGSRINLGDFLKDRGIEVNSDIGPYFTGFDFIAAGLIDDGKKIIEDTICEWEKKGIKKVITLTGQSQYIFETLLDYLEIKTDIVFISILDIADFIDADRAYLYGGSFFTRYLRKEERLNELIENNEEKPILNCPEFMREVDGDRRENIVGIWTPPICAEYHAVTTPENLQEKIYNDSMDIICNTAAKEMIVCDPYAYKALKDHKFNTRKQVYFLDRIG